MDRGSTGGPRRVPAQVAGIAAGATAIGGAVQHGAGAAWGWSWAAVVVASALAALLAGVLVRRTAPPPGAEADPGTGAGTDAGPARRLAELESQTASLRHDLRGILSPAMLVADRLSESDDPKMAKAGTTILRAVNRASERLAATKPRPDDAPHP